MIYGLFMWIILVGLGTMALVSGLQIVGATCLIGAAIIFGYALRSRK